jgi:hypothetical protein
MQEVIKMKRVTFFLAVPAVLCLSSGFANAQHGHGAGGAMTGVGMHGDAGMHGNANESTGAGGHATSSMMASTNPGGVLDHNSHLTTKLEGLLNLSGPNALATLKTDASGFKNFGQFMAAVHVSHNLGIPFSDLQAKMMGPNAVSLGKAIQELKPDVDAKTETKKATTEANEDAKETS